MPKGEGWKAEPDSMKEAVVKALDHLRHILDNPDEKVPIVPHIDYVPHSMVIPPKEPDQKELF